jgi:hypothetical protein
MSEGFELLKLFLYDILEDKEDYGVLLYWLACVYHRPYIQKPLIISGSFLIEDLIMEFLKLPDMTDNLILTCSVYSYKKQYKKFIGKTNILVFEDTYKCITTSIKKSNVLIIRTIPKLKHDIFDNIKSKCLNQSVANEFFEYSKIFLY